MQEKNDKKRVGSSRTGFQPVSERPSFPHDLVHEINWLIRVNNPLLTGLRDRLEALSYWIVPDQAASVVFISRMSVVSIRRVPSSSNTTSVRPLGEMDP